MAGGIRPPSPRKENSGTTDRYGHREFSTYTRRNPPMDLSEEKNTACGNPHDDFCSCRHGGALTGVDTVGRKPIHGVARGAYSCRYSG